MRLFFAHLDEKHIVGNFRENFDENAIETLNFIIEFYGKYVTKNGALGNNIIFLQQFFPFRGERFQCFPLAAPMV